MNEIEMYRDRAVFYFILFNKNKEDFVSWLSQIWEKNPLTIMQIKISQLYSVASTSDNVTVSRKQMLRVSPWACALC